MNARGTLRLGSWQNEHGGVDEDNKRNGSLLGLLGAGERVNLSVGDTPGGTCT